MSGTRAGESGAGWRSVSVVVSTLLLSGCVRGFSLEDELSCADGTVPGAEAQLDADGDSIPDVCDVCAAFDDRLDADGDTVPDGCDVCPGARDDIDADLDGKADGCDACPAVPGPLIELDPEVSYGGPDIGATISGVSFNGAGNVAEVAKGETVTVGIDYDVHECNICTPGQGTCIVFAPMGLIPSSEGTDLVAFCPYGGQAGCFGSKGHSDDTLIAPAEPGVYQLRFGLQLVNSCPVNFGIGDEATTVGVLCVRP